MFEHAKSVTMALILVAAPAVVEAQGQVPATPPAGTAPAFVLQSDNGDNRLQLGALVHFDGRFFPGDAQPGSVDTFQLRRFRTITQGQLARHFPFFLNVDVAGGVVNLRDAWFETRFSNGLRVRAGKFQAPFSYDRLTLIANLLFVERGLTTTVAADREVGFQVLGDLARNRLSYAVAVTNGVIDGGAADVDGNSGKDLTGRIVVRPWAAAAGHPLQALGIAAAFTSGSQPAALPAFGLPGRQVYFTYAPGAVGEGRRTRWSPQAFFYRGRFGGYAEYVESAGDIRRGAVGDEVTHRAWQAAASWVLTGEAASERNIRPRVSFDPPSRHFGALQLAARYQVLDVSRRAIALGFAAPAASRRAEVATLGLNWYMTPYNKWNLNFERTVFDDDPDGPRPAESAILLRAHFGF
jgi:phosphate-selective porin OprO and OprP